MREIEFRGKDRTGIMYNDWFYGSLDLTTDSEFPQIICKDRFGNTMFIDADKETIGQYTGLKDKNGKKIFEGDVIKARNNDELYKVHWEYFRFIIEDKWANMILPVQEAISHFECEIIGNIYDNPELLKGE